MRSGYPDPVYEPGSPPEPKPPKRVPIDVEHDDGGMLSDEEENDWNDPEFEKLLEEENERRRREND